MTSPSEKLQRLLGGAALAPLRQRLRRHFERRDTDDVLARLRVGQLTDVEREALAQLTGRPPGSARSLTIDVLRLDAEMQAAGIASSLRDALEQLDGPIPNRIAERNATLRAWASIVEDGHRNARLLSWLNSPGALGLLKRLARSDTVHAKALLEQADTVLERLPETGVARAQLAAQTLGDAHALDNGRPVASIVLAAWRMSATASDSEPAEESARETWARAGILVNELARPALFLNLPVARPASTHWQAGEPAYASLRQLLRTPPPWNAAGVQVFVCENPNVLAIAADRLGPRCAPLVCTDGMPAAAQRTLLSQLRQAGATLHYHGDFDWPGLQIANHVIHTWQAKPWRMAAADYETAARLAPRVCQVLPDSDIVATWDPDLATAMRRHRVPIAEESVTEELFRELNHSIFK